MRNATKNEIAAYARIHTILIGKIEFHCKEYNMSLLDARDRVLKHDNATSVRAYFERRKVFMKCKESPTNPTEYLWYEEEYIKLSGVPN